MNAGRPVTLTLLGAGARGELNIATLARKHADEMEFVAVAETHDGRRERFCRLFGMTPSGSVSGEKTLMTNRGANRDNPPSMARCVNKKNDYSLCSGGF